METKRVKQDDDDRYPGLIREYFADLFTAIPHFNSVYYAAERLAMDMGAFFSEEINSVALDYSLMNSYPYDAEQGFLFKRTDFIKESEVSNA